MPIQDFLIFRLRGLMSAFGDITVGERRSSWDAPSKSAVLGFIAACLGIEREHYEAHSVLEKHLGFAVRLDHAGRPLRDYHTAQAPTEASRNRKRKNGEINTRKDDLSCDELSTVLSERIYRLEAEYTVALWVKPKQQEDLERVQKALCSPVFTPYLGRKSCPLSFPPRPLILHTENLASAFHQYDAQTCEENNQLIKGGYAKKPSSESSLVWFEYDAGLTQEESQSKQVRQRRDSIRHRLLWQFSERAEGCLKLEPHYY